MEEALAQAEARRQTEARRQAEFRPTVLTQRHFFCRHLAKRMLEDAEVPQFIDELASFIEKCNVSSSTEVTAMLKHASEFELLPADCIEALRESNKRRRFMVFESVLPDMTQEQIDQARLERLERNAAQTKRQKKRR